jgi:hypothetical protein
LPPVEQKTSTLRNKRPVLSDIPCWKEFGDMND